MRIRSFGFVFSWVWVGLVTSFALGQAFDEDFQIWPTDLKIGGTIIASGGGEDPAKCTEIFRDALADDEPQIVVLNLCGAKLELREMLDEKDDDSMVVEFDVEQVADLDSAIREKIKNADGLILASPKNDSKPGAQIMDAVLSDLETLVDRSGVLWITGFASSKLGAINQKTVAHVTAAANASNLIPDSIIRTHYDDSMDRSQLLSGLAAHPRLVGIGIPKNTAMVLKGRKIRVVGENAVTFALMANERQPLRIQHVREAQGRRPNPYETIIDLTAWRRDAIERTLPGFPESNPPTPMVNKGALFIVGGGGMPNGLMDRMVEMAGGSKARMVYVPCTERDEVNPDQRIIRTWKEMGVASAVVFHTKDRRKANEDDDFLQPLKDATGIWFGGGRQWNFSDSYYGTEAHRLMKQVLERGGVIGGSSAGASVQGRYMCRANPVANFDIMAPGYERGLGFLAGVAIDQHFSQRRRQKDMTQLANRYPQLLGIGIDETTAIVVQKSQAEVVGRGKVYFYDRTLPVIPGDPDYVAVEAGQTFDLADRKVVTEQSK